MKWNSNAIECLIIGSIALALSILLTVTEANELWILFHSDYENKADYVQKHCMKLVLYVSAALISILKIFGVTQQRAGLLIPWLLAAFAVVTFTIYFIVGILMTLPYGHIEFAFHVIALIGLECLVIYPLCSLFAQMRRDRIKKLKRQARLNRKMVAVTV